MQRRGWRPARLFSSAPIMMTPPRFALFLSVPALAIAAPAMADDGLTLGGEVRARYETIDGQARAGFDSRDTLFSLRTRIHAEYRTGALRFGAELFDSRAYGADRGTPLSTGEVNALEPVQAYVAGDIDGVLGAGSRLSLTAGRMMLNLGSRRIVAADDYRNTTNGYTGLRADLAARGGIKATFVYTLPQMRRPDDAEALRDNRPRIDRESFDAVLWGGVVSRDDMIGRAMIELSFFHFGERDSPRLATRDRSLDTFGGRIIAEPAAGRVDYEVEILGQRGSISRSLAPGAGRQAVRASFVHADIGYSFRTAWKPRLSIEFDRASGDRAGGRYGRFDTLFGMRRADLAPSGIYGAVARANIVTPGIRIEAAPSGRLDGFMAYRPMWLAADEDAFSTSGVRDPAGRSGDFAGHQIEGRLRYWLVPKRLRFEFDGVLLAKGRFLRDAPNATRKRWTRYGSFNLTASF
ncbi:alginate export family protein [Sphingomonas sp. YL-JM2C]